MIYVFLAHGFEEVEAISVIDVLRRAEYDVKVVGVEGKQITGSHGITVTADITDAQVQTDDMEMVVLPGGMPGTLNLEKSPIVKASVLYCAVQGKLIGAICAAPSILGHWNLLKDKKAVCFPGFESELKGAVVCEDYVVTDGNIITAKGAGVAVDFALELVRKFSGEGLSEKIRLALQCR